MVIVKSRFFFIVKHLIKELYLIVNLNVIKFFIIIISLLNSKTYLKPLVIDSAQSVTLDENLDEYITLDERRVWFNHRKCII